MTPDDPRLDTLLDSVVGGDPVDWDRLEAGAGSVEQKARLRALRDVSRVAAFHRVLHREVGTEPVRDLERWGDLLLLERVGTGASGDVWRAWDPALQREVALKLLRPRDGAAPAELLEEARTLARVRDPHVVTVHGAAEHGGRVGLWMEFLHAPTLEREIERRGALPAAEVATLGAQLARALAAVHAAGALHRDVKPANVTRAADGRAVLMDFGLGQRRGGPRHDAAPFSGTPMFMSPERLAGSPATIADDVYALGATLHVALSGSMPFAAKSLDELRVAATRGPEPRLAALRPDAPRALVAVVERAMAPKAADRFESAAALAEALDPAAAPAAPARANGRRAGLRIAAGVGVAALLAFALLARLPRNRELPSAVNAPPLNAPGATTPAPAPGATTPVPATGGALAPYDVAAQFVKRGTGGDVTLATGDRVGPGDRLSLSFRATRPVWVYVLDADDRGETYLLFPQPAFDVANPLPADSAVVLPGPRAGRESAWTVTSRGGREHLLVVASPERVPELEAELAQLPAPRPGRPIEYARVGGATVERMRGIGGVSEVPKAAPAKGPAAVFGRIRALAGREQGVRGTWVRQVTLENPLR